MVWFLVFPRYPFPQKHYALPTDPPQHPHNPLHLPPRPLSIPSVTLPHTLHPPLIHDPIHINPAHPALNPPLINPRIKPIRTMQHQPHVAANSAIDALEARVVELDAAGPVSGRARYRKPERASRCPVAANARASSGLVSTASRSAVSRAPSSPPSMRPGSASTAMPRSWQ